MLKFKQSSCLPSINMNHTLTSRLDKFTLSNANFSNLYYQLGPKWDPKEKIVKANETYRTIINNHRRTIVKFNPNHPNNPNDNNYLSVYKEVNVFNALNIAKHFHNPLLIKSSTQSNLFPTLLDIAKKSISSHSPTGKREQKESVLNLNAIKFPVTKQKLNSFNKTIILKRLTYEGNGNCNRNNRTKSMTKIKRRYLEADLPIEQEIEEYKNLKQYEMREYIDKRKVIPFK